MKAIQIFYLALNKENIPIFGVVRICQINHYLFKRGKSIWVNMLPEKRMCTKVSPECPSTSRGCRSQTWLTWNSFEETLLSPLLTLRILAQTVKSIPKILSQCLRVFRP